MICKRAKSSERLQQSSYKNKHTIQYLLVELATQTIQMNQDQLSGSIQFDQEIDNINAQEDQLSGQQHQNTNEREEEELDDDFDDLDVDSLQGYQPSSPHNSQITANDNYLLQQPRKNHGERLMTFGNDDDLSDDYYAEEESFNNETERQSSMQNSTIKSSKVNGEARIDDSQEELSDYGSKGSNDEQISQYQNSLFADLQSQNTPLSLPSQKMNSSNLFGDSDMKQSYQTKAYNQTVLTNRYKTEKKEKKIDSQNSIITEKPTAVSRHERAENKKRFSKKSLELISRKFADYYAYQTNKAYTGDRISLRDIEKMFGLGHATVHKLYAQWMDDPYFYQRIKRYDRYRKQTKNPERKLTLDRLEEISRLIKENPFLTQHELCVQLNKNDDLKIMKCGKPQMMTRTIVGKLLRMGKFRKKRVKCIPKEKNTSKSLEKRYEYCLKYNELVVRKAKVYFLDESGFNLYMTRDKAWSRPNEEVTINCPISKGKRFSLIAIIEQDGLAHWRFIQGNYRKFQYLDFIRQLFQKMQEQKDNLDFKGQQRWIIMDNCAIHDKEQTINLARQYDISVLYLPSYSPQLNPIEAWFHEIKTKLRKINYSGQKQLFDIIHTLLNQYEKHDFSNYFYSSMKFVQKGLKKQKF